MEYELYHAGVKGMKWGVRKDRVSSDTPVTKVRKRGNTTTITSKQGNQKAKLTVKRDRGAKLVAKCDSAKVKVILSNTANVTAGALRVAAAFVPGMSVLNGVATAVTLGGTLVNLKK